MIVRPLDRNLDRAQPELISQKQQLWIEAPALNVLTAENGVRRITRERLEAALRVAILQSEDDAQCQVKQASIELPKPGLALGLQLSLQPARADRDVRSLRDCLEELASFTNGRGKIGVGEQ